MSIQIKTKAIPSNPRSKNYPAGSAIVNSGGGGGSTTIVGGDSPNVDILKVDDLRSATDENVFSSLRTLREILSRVIAKEDVDTELSDKNTLSSLRINKEIKDASTNVLNDIKKMCLSRVNDDQASGLITLLKGLVSKELAIFQSGIDVSGKITSDSIITDAISTRIIEAIDKLTTKSIKAVETTTDTLTVTDKIKGNIIEATEGITGKTITATDTIKGNNVQAVDTVSGKNATISAKTTTLNLLVQALADTYDLSVSHVATLMGTIVKDYISSESYVSGMSGNGMKIYKALNGDWNMELDNLTVRKTFSVFELVVQKMVHQGGMVIRSAAGGKLTKVTDGGTYWKCEYDSTDDFVKDDQIVCQAFTGTAIKRYWRLITSAGTGYFNLSKSDCETGSGTPEVGDDVSVLGNRANSTRQKAQIDCAVGDAAPYRDDYAGINSYSLAGKLITRTGELSGITDAVFGVLSGSGLYATNVYLKGMFILRSGKSVESELNSVNTAVVNAQKDATAAKNVADTAQTTANTAATNAASANSILTDIASDSKLTPSEKQQTKKEWDVIVSEKPLNNASAVKFNVATTSYDAAYNTLNTYITPLLASLTTTSDIVGTTFRNTFKVYYDARTNLLNAISAAAKALADNAQSKADAVQKSTEDLGTRITTVETKFEIREGQISSKVTEATTAATNAKKSETAASSSAGAASTKAGEASTSATNASKSATDAAGSATTAGTKAGEASASAGNAKKSADDAAAKLVTITEKESSINQTASGITLQVKEVQTKAGEAATSATNAGNSASTASSKATAAGNSATAAAGSAGTASTKAGEAATSATTATTKANAASSSATAAATSATNAKTSADASAVVLQTVSTKQSEINAKADQITLKVTEVTEKTVQATNAAELATAMSKGKMLYRDPSFINGMNGVSAYNNSGGGTVTVTRVSGVAGNPNGSGYCLKIMTTGASSPGWGGFLQAPTVKANQCLVYRLIANIPVGRTLSYARNDAGNGVSEKWLTSKSGTGNWEEYAYVLRCGATGTFSGCGHFYLTGGATPTASAPLIWYLSYATVFDVTDAEIDYIADAAGKYTTKTTYEAGIKVLSDSITSKVSQTDFNSLGTRVGNAESTISQHTTQISSKVAQTTFDALGKRVSSAETTIIQHTSQIALKASQADVTALGTRMSSAEAKITPDAIKLTVKSQTETIAADASKRTVALVDATGLDQNKFYPVVIGLGISVPIYTIAVSRTLASWYGVPSYSLHVNGFSVLCKWQTNGSGWGSNATKRKILEFAFAWSSLSPVGSIGQMTNSSNECIYVRGGSKYDILVEGATGVPVSLHSSAYTNNGQTVDIKTEVVTPVVDLEARPTTDDIKSQIALDGFGISVFGKKIDFTGRVTFSSMDSATQSTINGKATTGYVDTAKSSAISTAASDAQSKADAAKQAAISSAASDAQAKANTAKNDAISSAATDATTKANNAKSAAITAAATDAQTKANTAKNDAITAAAKDATTKADNAKSGAISTAAADASSKADSAKNAAISAAASDAQTKANNALSTSRNDVAVKLGYASYSDMEAKATANQTIINGGYIRTSLIQANTITADKIATGTITADKLNIGNIQAQILTADAIQALDITTGKLKVTTGAMIGGLKVSGNWLTNEGFNNDASIVLRNDSAKTFVGLGQNMISSTAGGDTCVCRLENKGYNNMRSTGLMITVSGSTRRNIALDIKGDICVRSSNDAENYGVSTGIIICDTWLGNDGGYRMFQFTNGILTNVYKTG